MNSFITTLASLFIIYATIATTVYCAELQNTNLPKSQVTALTRDHFGRMNPDDLFHGFFPVWAVIQLILGGIFLVVGVLGGVCYLLGCRPPSEERKKSIK